VMARCVQKQRPKAIKRVFFYESAERAKAAFSAPKSVVAGGAAVESIPETYCIS